MIVKNIASNQTQIDMPSGIQILVSYSTPVAVKLPATPGHGAQALRTSKKWSQTTSSHINKWLGDHDNVDTVSQAKIGQIAVSLAAIDNGYSKDPKQRIAFKSPGAA